MRKFSIYIFIFMLLISYVFAAGKLLLPSNKNIQYVGRWDKCSTVNYHSYWGGAYFKIKFRGNELNIKLAAQANVYVKIDNRKMVLFKNDPGWIKISPDILDKSVHNVKVIAKFQNDEIQLEGISLNKGAKLLKPEAEKFWLEFIGDSITSGDKISSGNTSAYPWLIGEFLHTAHTQISYCGITLVDGYHYGYEGSPKIGMESAYLNLKEPNHKNNLEWSFQNHPNVIAINLGTNDHNLMVGPELFKQTFTQLMRHIRFIHPTTQIMILVPFNQSYHQETCDVIAKESTVDSKLTKVETQNWLSEGDFVDGTHPTDEGHVKVAQKLEKLIEPFLIK